MNIYRKKGFTLVELLIVIALIAILSVAVLATINPIEQSNKARDAKFKNDAAEVLNALERYYTSQATYPWNSSDVGVGTTVAWGTVVAVGSTDPRFGVLGVGGSEGVLISTSELKGAFMGKEPFDSPQPQDRMYIYHNGEDSNYVCFVPKANANRTGTIADTLKCLSGLGSAVTLVDIAAGTCVNIPDGGWSADNLLPGAVDGTGVPYANLLCVPEGDIQ